MSTEIKPGQVWAWRARQGDPFTIDRLDGDMAEYHYGKRVANTTYSAPRSLIQRTADLVTDATPAPSKVAPKDRHPEQLARFRKQVHWATDLKRGDVIVSVEAHNAVTVEREEPAPEPEPEWKPEAIVRATVNGVPDTLLMRLTPGYEGGFVWATPTLTPRRPQNEQSWLLYEDADIADARPLVAIDPAAVDVDALADLARQAWFDGGGPELWRAVTHAVLAPLGIEATS